jgi:sugar/nucleoside kinase (ribokinase family)
MEAVCVGLLVADIFISPIDALPRAGELTAVDGFLTGVGGCAANTAACLRRLDRSVTVVGKVGRDLFGDFVIRDLERLGVDSANVGRSDAQPTSTTVIVNVRGEDRRYLHCFGANAAFSIADVDTRVLDDARLLYVGGYLAMPEVRPGDLARLFHAAKTRSITTVLDVVVPAGAPVSLADVDPVLTYTDYFLPNEDEAGRLTARDGAAGQAAFLSDRFPDCAVVITRGSRGSLARRGNHLIETAAFPFDSVDESGAGDAFAAGLIAGVLDGWPLDRCLQFAAAVGGSCTRALGCTAGVFRKSEALEFLAGAQCRSARST